MKGKAGKFDMFLGNKLREELSGQIERLMECLREKLNQDLEGKFHGLEQGIAGESSRLDEVARQIGQLQTSVQKHDMAIEDLLAEWEERSADEADAKARFREQERSEGLLLELFEAYQEQFWNLKRFAGAKDAEWSGQLALMEEQLARVRQLCGIGIISECGAEVNYDLHEVIEVLSTADTRLDGLVAAVYRCGYLYKGKVKKKAQVAAYRM